MLLKYSGPFPIHKTAASMDSTALGFVVTSYLGTDPNVGRWRDASKEAGTGEPVRERG